MIKKIILVLTIFLVSVFTLTGENNPSYNPSKLGEALYELGSPDIIAQGASVAGGGLQSVSAEHIALNPALTAGEQRVVINTSFTTLIANKESVAFGFAGQLGAVIPSKYGVFTGSVYGIHSTLDSLDFGTNFTIRAGFAKDVTDKLYVGTDLSFACGTTLGVNLALGFTYNYGTVKWLPVVKDFRLGFSLTAMGYVHKVQSSTPLYNGKTTAYPSPFTPHIGIAGTLFEVGKVKGGMSLDFSFPTFQNAIINTGFQVLFFDIVKVKIGEELNIRELVAGKASVIPSISLSAKIGINTKDDSFFAKQGWQQSEIVPVVGYRYLNDGIQAISAGLVAYLGLRDTSAPEIILW